MTCFFSEHYINYNLISELSNEYYEVKIFISYLIRAQSFPKNQHFLFTNTHQVVRNISFLENFAYVQNG